jgi:hypothetical protein
LPRSRGDAEDGSERALVLAPLARRHHVADDRLREHHQATTAEALDGAITDELDHVLRGAAQHRTRQEDDDG